MTLYDAAAKAWMAKDPDPKTKAQLQELIETEDLAALEASFSVRLAFGTAGLRGIVGPGPGRMNLLVVQETTAGLARYVLENEGKDKGVVIAYDGRTDSEAFAHAAAGVLAAAGIQVHLYDGPAPTPLGAFAVRRLNAAAGIVVTASHNPPEYNGYKVYREGGTQINDPIDAQIAAQIDIVASEATAPRIVSLDEAKSLGLLHTLGEAEYAAYVQATLHSLPEPAAAKEASAKGFKVAYTPLHGVGAPLAERLLKKRGYESYTVKEQREPDGLFPTVKFPNPEEPGAMDLVMRLADEHGCQVAIANDPDADRLCACARDSTGKMQQLSGDELGALLGDLLLSRASSSNVGQQAWVLNTIVSSRLLAALAGSYGAKHRETLTGFKWLGPAAASLNARSGNKFVFAYEEALGYMATDNVWDKDGLSALLALADLAAELHVQGKTLIDRLEDIHRGVGLAVSTQRTMKLAPGVLGSSIMEKVRAKGDPRRVGSYDVALVLDLANGRESSLVDEGEIPKNDVLRYYVAAGDLNAKSDPEQLKLKAPRVQVRPSGTEPKVKIYCEALGTVEDGESYEAARARVRSEIDAIADAFFEYLSESKAV